MFSPVIHVVTVRAPRTAQDRLHLAAQEAQTTGWEELAAPVVSWRVYFAKDAHATRFAQLVPDLVLSAGTLAVENWNALAQSEWQATAVGDRFFLHPPGYSGPLPPGHIPIEMFPSAAFGAGDHPTTRLCLELLASRVNRNTRYLDVGCGDGTLCLAAHLVGARLAVGCDIDLITIAFARQRCADWPLIHLAAGSADAMRPGSFDLVTLNTTLNVTSAVIADVIATLQPGAQLILSGFDHSQEARCEQIAATHGLHLAQRRSADGWSAFVANR